MVRFSTMLNRSHPRLHYLLRREGFAVNRKRVYRLYREEGLKLRRKRLWGWTS
jgi:putative transposase